jgi:hypothetical protein
VDEQNDALPVRPDAEERLPLPDLRVVAHDRSPRKPMSTSDPADLQVLSRVIRAREAVADGDLLLAEGILADLEAELTPKPTLRCRLCPSLFRFPGQLDEHLRVWHPDHWLQELDRTCS